MLRLLALVASLVAAPLFAYDLTPPERSPGHAHAERVGYPPGEAYSLVIDASELPGETGWFLVPVTTTREAYVSIEARVKHVSPDAGNFGNAVIVALGDQAYVAGGLAVGRWNFAEVAARGEGFACCDDARPYWSFSSGTLSGGGGLSGPVTPDRPLHVGLAAVGFAPGSKLRITLTSDAALHAGAARTGTTAEVADLVSEARLAGTTLRIGGQTFAGEAGEARRAWTPQATGLLLANYNAQGAASATLNLDAPGLAPIRAHDVSDLFGVAHAIGRGAFSASLADLVEPRYQPGFAPQEAAVVSAALLFADLDLAATGHDQHEAPLEDW